MARLRALAIILHKAADSAKKGLRSGHQAMTLLKIRYPNNGNHHIPATESAAAVHFFSANHCQQTNAIESFDNVCATF